MTFPDIDPVAFYIGPLAIRWYGLAYLAGIFGTWFLCRKLIRKQHLWGNVPPPSLSCLDDLMLAATFGIVAGGRIAYVIFYKPSYYMENPLKAFAIWDGGMSFHGGLLGCALAIILLARHYKLSALSLIDLACSGAPIGLFFGRLSNFINGELWGRVTSPDNPLGIIFPFAGSDPRHPSQLYEAFLEGFILFIIMQWAVYKFGFRRPGFLAGIFASGYAIARITCEFFREPDADLGFLFASSISLPGGGLTMGMLLSLPLLLAGLFTIYWTSKGKTLPEQTQ